MRDLTNLVFLVTISDGAVEWVDELDEQNEVDDEIHWWWEIVALELDWENAWWVTDLFELEDYL